MFLGINKTRNQRMPTMTILPLSQDSLATIPIDLTSNCSVCGPAKGSLFYSICDKCAEKRKTVGQVASELSKDTYQQDVIETQREMQKGYIDELIKAAKAGEEKYGTKKHFYICVQTRRERLLTNVIRNQFYTRQTRPIPQYDLALYYYNPNDEKLSFIWCIPDKETCLVMQANKQYIPKEQEQLLGFVLSFMAGTLI